jgi:hypothetical protein
MPCAPGGTMEIKIIIIIIIIIIYLQLIEQAGSCSEYIALNSGLLNNELRRIWQELLWPNLKYYPSIFLQRLSKMTKILGQDNWYPSLELGTS